MTVSFNGERVLKDESPPRLGVQTQAWMRPLFNYLSLVSTYLGWLSLGTAESLKILRQLCLPLSTYQIEWKGLAASRWVCASARRDFLFAVAPPHPRSSHPLDPISARLQVCPSNRHLTTHLLSQLQLHPTARRSHCSDLTEWATALPPPSRLST